jgi:hypothetical protein
MRTFGRRRGPIFKMHTCVAAGRSLLSARADALIAAPAYL